MLRLPVKIILECASGVLIILGAHGLYVTTHRLEALFGGGVDRLFLSIGMPSFLGSVVEWMSVKGFMSWVVPFIFVAVGLVVGFLGWKIQGKPKSGGGRIF